MKKSFGALLVAVSAIAFTANASAMEYKPYIGMDYNYTQAADHDRNNFNSASVNVGTNYNQYFGTEVFYQFSDSDKKDGVETSFKAFGLDAYGYLPLGCDQEFSLLGTVGIGQYYVDTKVEDEKRNSDTGLGYRLGAGAQYAIDENLAVRALARYSFMDKINNMDHMMEYSVGAKYSF